MTSEPCDLQFWFGLPKDGEYGAEDKKKLLLLGGILQVMVGDPVPYLHYNPRDLE